MFLVKMDNASRPILFDAYGRVQKAEWLEHFKDSEEYLEVLRESDWSLEGKKYLLLVKKEKV